MMPKKYHNLSFIEAVLSLFVLLLTTTQVVGQTMPVRTLHYTTRDGMASNVVNTIIQDRQGYLWLGTNLGLTRYDGYRFVNFYHEKNGKRQMENITGIVEDTVQNRLIVCGTDYYLYPFDLNNMQLHGADTTLPSLYYTLKSAQTYYEPATVRRSWERGVQYKNNIGRHDAIHYVTLPNGNEVWTTIENGFYIYDAQTKLTEHFTSANPNPVIESDQMSEVLLDRSGTVWMTNYVAGLYKLQFAEENVRYHQLTHGSPSNQANSVRSFSELKDGRILVSNMEGDVFCYNLATHHCELFMHKEHRIYSTLTDSQDRLWMGTRNGGVWVDNRHLNTADGLKANIIFHLLSTANDTVWISTLDGGLIAAKTDTAGDFHFTTYLEEELVHQVATDQQGRLWVATESGVFVGKDNAFKRVYEGSKAVSICCTDDGRVLVATIGDGVLIIQGDEQTFLTTANGLTNDCVKAIAWDEHIGIVAATDAGVTVMAPHGETLNIYSPNGMIADTYNESASIRLSDGRILLGSFDGFVELTHSRHKANFSSFDNAIQSPPSIPKKIESESPLITSITVNYVPHYKQRFTSLTLPHDQNNLSITFSCLDYKNQPSIIYSYRLDGLDDDWRPSTKESTAFYNNLSPGHYRFRLHAARAGQAWGEETICDIHIRQPWWWTWWARIIYLLTILLFIRYEWKHYNERQNLRRQLDQRLTTLYTLDSEHKVSVVEATDMDSSVSTTETEAVKKVANNPIENDVTKNANKDFLDKLDGIILPNLLQQDLDIAFLADKMCMSHSTLYRRIKSLTGMTANEYVRKHRLSKAMQLLRKGIPATQVAIQCGFNSSSYFTRCFKSEYGILPSEV